MEQHSEQEPERSATGVPAAPVEGDTYVTISDAARMTGASRTRLYRYIEAGKIERTVDGRVSVQALLSAGFEFKEQRPGAATPGDNLSYMLTHYTDMARQLNESLEDQIEALREQLRFAHEQLVMSQQREVQLLQMLQAGQAAAAPSGSHAAPHTAPHESPHATADAAPATHRLTFDDESAVVVTMQPSAMTTEASPNAQQAGFFGRWRSRPGEPSEDA